MTTSTFTVGGTVADIYSSNATYATARAGSSLTARSSSAVVGQTTGYGVYETFISFDTSSIPDTDDIISVTLELYLSTDASAADFVVQARLHDWGASVTTADWVAGADLSGKTLLATLDSNGIGATGSLKAFTSDAAFKSNINKTGVTYIILCSKEQVDNSAPTGNEYLSFASAADLLYQKLTVVHAEPPSGTIAATLQPLTMAAVGSTIGGPIAVSLQPLTAALTGWHEAFGTIAATLQPLTALAIGIWRRGGTNVPLGARASARLPRPGTGKARRD